MATRTWNGGEGDWYDPTRWTTTGGAPNYPQPGDTAIVGSGEVYINGAEARDDGTFDAEVVTLGAMGEPATVLRALGAVLNGHFAINLAGSAEVLSHGRSVIEGTITDAVAGTTLTLGSSPDPSGGFDLVLQDGGLSLAAGTALDLEGKIVFEDNAGFATSSTATFVNDADVKQIGASGAIGGGLTGTGTWELGPSADLQLGGGVSASQTIAFDGVGGRLTLADPVGFAGAVSGFAFGDFIDFTTVSATAASYDAATKRLMLTNNGVVVAVLNDVSAQAGPLTVTSDGPNGGTTVGYAVAISPVVSYTGGVFHLTGAVSSTAGVAGVEISAVVDGARHDLGTAPVNPDGTFAFQDAVTDQQTFLQATFTDGASGTATSADPGFNLQGGLGPNGRYGEQRSFSPTGEVSQAVFRPNGQRFLNLEASGQTVDLSSNDIVANHFMSGDRFVFTQGDGVDVIGGFATGGADPDRLALPSSEFKNFAAILRDTTSVNGSALIIDPKSGEGIYLQGTSVAQVMRNPRDFSFG